MESKFFVPFFIIATAFGGYYFRALTKSGAVAAAIVGFIIAIGLGIKGLLLLGAFFFSSSLLSKYKADKKQSVSELHEKTDLRDWQQVGANGGVAAIASLCFAFSSSSMFLFIFLIAIATSTADTWASEIGVLSKNKPISMKSFERVDRGTSGAVSLLGTLIAFSGALFIGIVALLLFEQVDGQMLILVVLLGFLGNVIDTLLGAYSQVTYSCECCGLQTEKRLHCNERTTQLTGTAFINNEAVNFLSGFIASLSGVLIYYLLFH